MPDAVSLNVVCPKCEAPVGRYCKDESSPMAIVVHPERTEERKRRELVQSKTLGSKFIQIACKPQQTAHDASLYALDEDGNVWGYSAVRIEAGKVVTDPSWQRMTARRGYE